MKISSGATPKGGKFSYSATGAYLIRSQNVRNLSFDPTGLVQLNEEAAKKLQNVEVHQKDVLLNITGDSVARVCVAADEYLPARVNQHVAIIRPDNSYLNAEFLAYYLASPEMQARMLQLAHGKGTSRNALTKKMISRFVVPYPPLSTQDAIADILSQYDSLIKNSKIKIKLLKEISCRLYKEWFVDFEFPGYENVQINGGLPEHWKRVSLGALLGKLETGSRPKGGAFSDRGLNSCVSIGAENVIDLGQYDFDNEKFVSDEYAEKMARGHVADRDILIYKDGAYSGRTSLFQDGFPHETCVVNEHVFLLHSADPNLQYYLFFTLQQKNFYQTMQAISKSKSAQPGLDFDDLRKLKVLLPPKRLIKMFDSTVAPNIKQLFIEARRIRLLYETRDRLLPKLFSREIEV